MKASDTHEVEVTLHLRVPKSTPERHLDRLRMALAAVAADMDGVIEVGVEDHTTSTLTRAKLTLIWNEVVSAVPVVLGMAPADSVWGGMTCTEAEALASIFAAADHPEVAEFIIDQHGLGDDDEEDTHHEAFLTARKEGRA